MQSIFEGLALLVSQNADKFPRLSLPGPVFSWRLVDFTKRISYMGVARSFALQMPGMTG